MTITYTFETNQLTKENLQNLFLSVEWESASHPEDLYNGMLHSDSVVTAWDGDRLMGLTNAMSDGFMAVYFHYVLTDPAYQGQGVGKVMMQRMLEKYAHIHTKVLVSYPKAIGFYKSLGFESEDTSMPMYVYK